PAAGHLGGCRSYPPVCQITSPFRSWIVTVTRVVDPLPAVAMHSNFEPGFSGGSCGQLTVTVTPDWALMPLAMSACACARLKVSPVVVALPITGTETTMASNQTATAAASRPQSVLVLFVRLTARAHR